MRRKVNNSEIHETKRYYEVPSEKVQEWSDTIENLTKQSDQYKTERDTLIDDLSWYKAKVSRLEQRHSKLVDENTRLQNELYTMGLNQDEADDKIKKSERENRDYKVANRNLADYGHEWKNEYVKLENKTKVCKSLLSEISQHIGNKPSSSTYKYFRAKLDSIGN
ncbi:hypothetical protein M4K87_06350 [Staphylococcus equorum]|uniref:hypothetical protein n=1 Tax=Staphylococcus equorum TaxID=246432 RepID=UPI002408660B|nr:hypothetical protein [Staphylococcus equorum]MDG0825075.1 hypothetical protein [Staphylococcus equorum]